MNDEHPLTCDHVLELLDEYRSGELPAESQAEVQAHLLSCAACAAALENDLSLGRLIKESINSSEQIHAPEGVSDRVREIIAESVASRPGGLHRWHGIAAVLALAAFIGALSYPAIQFSQKSRDRSLAYEKANRKVPASAVSRSDSTRLEEGGEARLDAEIKQKAGTDLSTANTPSGKKADAPAYLDLPAVVPAPSTQTGSVIEKDVVVQNVGDRVSGYYFKANDAEQKSQSGTINGSIVADQASNRKFAQPSSDEFQAKPALVPAATASAAGLAKAEASESRTDKNYFLFSSDLKFQDKDKEDRKLAAAPAAGAPAQQPQSLSSTELETNVAKLRDNQVVGGRYAPPRSPATPINESLTAGTGGQSLDKAELSIASYDENARAINRQVFSTEKSVKLAPADDTVATQSGLQAVLSAPERASKVQIPIGHTESLADSTRLAKERVVVAAKQNALPAQEAPVAAKRLLLATTAPRGEVFQGQGAALPSLSVKRESLQKLFDETSSTLFLKKDIPAAAEGYRQCLTLGAGDVVGTTTLLALRDALRAAGENVP